MGSLDDQDFESLGCASGILALRGLDPGRPTCSSHARGRTEMQRCTISLIQGRCRGLCYLVQTVSDSGGCEDHAVEGMD